MQAQHFQVLVPIHEDKKKDLIFGLKARLPIGVILGFLGYQHEVLPVL